MQYKMNIILRQPILIGPSARVMNDVGIRLNLMQNIISLLILNTEIKRVHK